jgi:hypothetical protein
MPVDPVAPRSVGNWMRFYPRTPLDRKRMRQRARRDTAMRIHVEGSSMLPPLPPSVPQSRSRERSPRRVLRRSRARARSPGRRTDDDPSPEPELARCSQERL